MSSVIYLIILIVYVRYTFIEFKNKRLLSLSFLSLTTFVLLYILPELLFYLTNYQFRNSFFKQDNELLYNTSVFLSFFSILFGIWLSRKHNQKNVSLSNLKIIPHLSRKTLIFCMIMLVIGIYSALATLMSMGNIYNILLSSSFGAEYLNARVHSEGSGVFGALIWLIPLNLIYIYIYLKFKIKSSFFVKFLQLLLLGIPIFLFVLLTVRYNLISLLIIIFYYLVFTDFKFSKKVLILFPSLFFALIFLQGIRIYDIYSMDNMASFDFFLQSFEHKNITHYIISETNYYGYTYFQHLQDIFVFLVPRSIWEAKPIGSYLNNLYFPDVTRVGSEKAIGIVGEGYSALGLGGVFIISLILGYTISFVEEKIYSHKNIVNKLMIAAIFVPLSIFSVRSNLFGKHLVILPLLIINMIIIIKYNKLKWNNIENWNKFSALRTWYARRG